MHFTVDVEKSLASNNIWSKMGKICQYVKLKVRGKE
jgi:hypothetical protein